MSLYSDFSLKPIENSGLYLDNSLRVYIDPATVEFDKFSASEASSFVGEFKKHLGPYDELMDSIRDGREISSQSFSSFLNSLHTIKGLACQIGGFGIGNCIHLLESILGGKEANLDNLDLRDGSGISDILEEMLIEILDYISSLAMEEQSPTEEEFVVMLANEVSGDKKYEVSLLSTIDDELTVSDVSEVQEEQLKETVGDSETREESLLATTIRKAALNLEGRVDDQNPIYSKDDMVLVRALLAIVVNALNKVEDFEEGLSVLKKISESIQKEGSFVTKNVRFLIDFSNMLADSLEGIDGDQKLIVGKLGTVQFVLTRKETQEDAAAPKSAAPKSAATKSAAPNASASTKMEVELTTLNSLINNIEGLVLWRNRISKFSEKLDDISYENEDEIKLRAQVAEARAEYLEILTNVDLITNNLQITSENLRVLGIRSIFNDLRGLAGTVAKEYKKKVRISINSNDVKVDKASLTMVKSALTHIIRNSVYHGIESSDERLAAGKSRMGEISLSAFYGEKEITIKVSDDGGGIPTSILKKKAIEAGIIKEKEAEKMSDDEACRLIFHKGLSSAESVDGNAGRGTGMDAVSEMVEGIGGYVSIDSVSGEGTTFTISLPLTISIIKAIKVKLFDQTIALPISSIFDVGEIETSGVEQINNDDLIAIKDVVYEVVKNNDIFPFPDAHIREAGGVRQFVIISHLDKKVVLFIDDLIGKEELIIKNLAMSVMGITGAAISGDGNPVLIANPEYIVLKTLED